MKNEFIKGKYKSKDGWNFFYLNKYSRIIKFYRKTYEYNKYYRLEKSRLTGIEIWKINL